MEPWEVMTSESQERMLAIVTPESWPAVEEVCRRWEVRATVIGRVTAPDEGSDGVAGRLRIREGFDGPVLADVPAASLADEAPLYHRPLAAPADLAARRADDPGDEPPRDDGGADLLALLCDPSWVWRQYDHQLFLNTVVGPGGDAALLRLAGPGLPPSERGMAVTTDASPRWCAVDPRAGTALVLAESLANLACVGARAVAVVNCLNFGNPEHPEVMWQLSEAVDGLAEACRGLRPAGHRGQRQPLQRVGRARHRPDGRPRACWGWSIGSAAGHRGPAGPTARRWCCSGPARRPTARRTRWPGAGGPSSAGAGARGTLPPLDTERPPPAGRPGGRAGGRDAGRRGGPAHRGARRVGRRPRGGPGRDGRPLGDGGWSSSRRSTATRELFCELPSRVVAATDRPEELVDRAAAAGVAASVLGRAGGERLVVPGLVDLGVDELREAHDGRPAPGPGRGTGAVGGPRPGGSGRTGGRPARRGRRRGRAGPPGRCPPRGRPSPCRGSRSRRWPPGRAGGPARSAAHAGRGCSGRRGTRCRRTRPRPARPRPSESPDADSPRVRGWARTVTAARAPGQVGHLGRGDPGLGDVGRPSLGQPAVEGVGDRLGRPVADQHGGHVGPARRSPRPRPRPPARRR